MVTCAITHVSSVIEIAQGEAKYCVNYLEVLLIPISTGVLSLVNSKQDFFLTIL